MSIAKNIPEKVKLSGYLFIGLAIYYCLALLGLMGVSVLGAVAALANALSGQETILLVLVMLFGILGSWLMTALYLITGLGLLRARSWARPLAIVLAVMQLFSVPVGTILGGVVLFCLVNDKEVTQTFAHG